MSEIDIPAGWELKTIEEICTKITDGEHLKPKITFDGIPFVSAKDLKVNGIDFSHVLHVDKSDAIKFRKKCNPEKNDILIGSRGTIGRICIVDTEQIFCLLGSVILLKLPLSIESKFVLYFLKSSQAQNQLLNASGHSVVKAIYLKDIKKIQIPLPNLQTQKKIIKKLENILNQLNEKKKSIIFLQNVKKIEKLNLMWKQSILTESFSGNLTDEWRRKNSSEAIRVNIDEVNKRRNMDYEKKCEDAIKLNDKKPKRPENLIIVPLNNDFFPKIPNSWLTVTLTDIASIRHYAMSSGPFGSALGNKDYLDEGIPVVRGKNIQNGEFILKKFVYISETKASELKRSSIYPDDIVSVAVGYSGSSAIVPKELKFAIISQNCNKITFDSSLALPEYVNYFLQMEGSKNSMKSKTTDTARPFLSLTNLKKIMIPLPPIQEQKQMIQTLNKKFTGLRIFEKKIFDLKNEKNKTLDYLDTVYFKILQSAFSGKLLN